LILFTETATFVESPITALNWNDDFKTVGQNKSDEISWNEYEFVTNNSLQRILIIGCWVYTLFKILLAKKVITAKSMSLIVLQFHAMIWIKYIQGPRIVFMFKVQ